MNTELKKFQRNKLWYAICSSSLVMTWLMTASVVQASDLQIYAVPKAGKKTIIMMLDTSGSMGYGAGYNSGNTSGFGIYDDYDRVCSGLKSITSSTSYANGKLYSVQSTTTPNYSRNFCYISASSASATVKAMDGTGCKPVDASGNEYSYPLPTGITVTGYRCFDRLTRLKDGMFKFLDSRDSNLPATLVGVGNFSSSSRDSTDGDGKTGQILVPTAKLGDVSTANTSGSQRYLLKDAIAHLQAYNGTPTANAYAEAAAYLMGTTTLAPFVTVQKDWYKQVATTSYTCPTSGNKYLNPNNGVCYSTYSRGTYGGTTSNSATSINITYTQCTAWSTTSFSGTPSQSCSTWGTSLGSTVPSDLAQDGNYQASGSPSTTGGSTSNTGSSTTTTIYYVNDSQSNPSSGYNGYSGFSKSVSTSKNGTSTNSATAYISPLPATADRVSCDGQGVYLLSDGAANSSGTAIAQSLMKNSLDSSGGSFSCPNSGGLTTSDSSAAYNCIGEYAKALFDKTRNPTGVPIQTAFVGFGNDFKAGLNGVFSQDYALSSCKLGSRSQNERRSNDQCSPGTTPSSQAITAPGYGNGVFNAAFDADDVTNSVIKFINAIGGIPLDPLTTGQISVPYDALNPNNLSQTGYLRAFEPDPASSYLTWKGNLKKYSVAMSGANIGAFQGASGGLVYDDTGGFKTGTKDYWNTSAYTDGGKVFLGGAYLQVPLPYNGQTETTDTNGLITRYAYTASSKLRNLFTDVSSVTGSSLTPSTGSQSGTNLLQIPEKPASAFNSVSSIATYVLGKFDPSNGQAVLKDFPTTIKLKLLNYLGYSTDITSSSLPTNLTAQDAPYLSMGGSIHSLPVQLTYSGTLDSQGNLTSTRDQSIVYGSMEGGLHIVDASSGEEQMVFVPSEILNDPTKSKALVVGQTDILSPSHGVDATWVSDPSYAISTATSGGSTVTKVTARQMNIYGGMRMGGNSYYGLNVLNPSSPKLLFRIDKTTSGFDRLGQTWSKPVLANVRYNGKITRVMIVGGGYDQCYENPNFSLGANVSNTDFTDTSCNNKSQAQGNAVYIINAKTGDLIWSATNSNGASDGRQYMTHSIVSRISTLDRDADGLVDHLYFGDLGGQVFRADLNNKATSTSGFGVRVVRLANLATNDANNDANNDYRGSKAPRFYVQPTVTIHDQGANTFIVIGIASGNRSTPLDVYPIQGREGMLPANALNNQPTNNVYGILDRDFIKRDLITGNPTLDTQDKERSAFKKNPQILTGTQRVVDFFFPSSGSGVAGWYRSLSSQNTSTSGINSVERADNSFRTKGGLKAFEEEPIAITNNLLVPVYDPEGTGIEPPNPCKPRVIGETDWQRYCLPYGACLNSNGTLNTNLERKSGFLTKTTNCPAGVGECNDNVLGAGIRGITFVPKPDSGATNSCGKLTIAGNTQGTGEWQCTSRLIQTRWYERYR